MFVIRTVKQEDIQEIIALCEAAAMDIPKDYDHVFVAEEREGVSPENGHLAATSSSVVGFVRIQVIDKVAYVSPVIVSAAHRRQGIGCRLMRRVMAEADDVRFVARGHAVDFYRELGFVPVAWDALAPEMTQDCETCEVRASCQPLPMAWRRGCI